MPVVVRRSREQPQFRTTSGLRKTSAIENAAKSMKPLFAGLA
jgi:hypothetical protein